MKSVREHIRAVVGSAKASGISDKEIDDASWEYYFDLDQTMDYILGTVANPRPFQALTQPRNSGQT